MGGRAVFCSRFLVFSERREGRGNGGGRAGGRAGEGRGKGGGRAGEGRGKGGREGLGHPQGARVRVRDGSDHTEAGGRRCARGFPQKADSSKRLRDCCFRRRRVSFGRPGAARLSVERLPCSIQRRSRRLKVRLTNRFEFAARLDPESCREGAKVSSLPFSVRLDGNIQDVRRTRNIDWDGRTVYLEEKKSGFRMGVKIENVDRGLVVINFDHLGGSTTYLRGGKGFGDRCDFLVLEETDSEYAGYLIELENQVPANHAISQLRWSAPYLRYILEVFLEDSLMEFPEKKLNVRFFMVGTRLSGLVNKGGMKRQSARMFERWEVSTRLDMYYRVYTAGHRFEFSEFKEVSQSKYS